MGQRMKDFPDGSFLEYDQGSFDSWCVYLTRKNSSRRALRDADCFSRLKQLAGRYGAERVYRDYVRIYDITGRDPDASVLAKISQIAQTYGGDALDADILFSVLYMAMISEEHKANTRLGKRIKRLGVYQLLMEKKSVDTAANSTRKMKAPEIDKLCRAGGF